MAREIIIEPYSKEWIEQYKQAERLLSWIFNDKIINIQHIGSTSIDGLSAKPTIDILIVVKNIDEVESLNEIMEHHGFIAQGENGIKGRRYFYKTLSSNPFIETHHIHVYQVGNPKFNEGLLFRDYLRIDDGTLREYEALKIDIAKRFRHDPLSYTTAKADFILNTIKRARAYFARCERG